MSELITMPSNCSTYIRNIFVVSLVICGLNSKLIYAKEARIPDTIGQRVAACVVCHGKEGRAGSDGYYPRIAGKPATYLYNQLINFRDGKRTYPVMTAMLENMSDAYLREIALYFSEQHPPYPAPQAARSNATERERGRVLAQDGDERKGIPACVTCHSAKITGTAPAIPGLIGLPRDYLLGQIGAWKIGTRKAATPDCMAHIVQKMDAADISAVTAWLSEQRVPEDASPAHALKVKLPLECGKLSP